jgi:hypothetical protein
MKKDYFTNRIKNLEALHGIEFSEEAQNVISELNGLSFAEKKKNLVGYSNIGKIALEKGIAIPGYDLKQFSINPGSKKIAKGKNILKAYNENDDPILNYLKSISNKLYDQKHVLIFRSLSGGEEYYLIVIRESGNEFIKDEPVGAVQQLLYGNDNAVSEIHSIFSQLGSINFYVLISLSPKIDTAPFERIMKAFGEHGYDNELERLVLDDNDDSSKKIVLGNHYNLSDLIDVGRCLFSIVLNNDLLTPAEEEILKRSYGGVSLNTLKYEIIMSGKSGSKVVQVKPSTAVFEGHSSVIKIAKRNDKKLNQEMDYFKNNVEFLDGSYKAQPVKTELLSAIKYPYASQDGDIKAHPMALEFNKEWDMGKVSRLVNDIYGITLMNKWRSTLKKETCKIGDLYNEYLGSLKLGIKKNIELNISNSNCSHNSQLIEACARLLDIQRGLLTKTCHGDLHTENIFIDDESGVKLIDFGKTTKHHAPIDHIMLECSIKFNHIPKFMAIQDLIVLEHALLSIDSFTEKCISVKMPPLLLKYYNLIAQIRINSIDFIGNKENYIDYLVGLFLMTIRQIEYDNMNQNYAIESAYILLEHIGKEIPLS